MWVLSRDGFVSVVAYDPAKDFAAKSPFKHIAKKAGTHLLVRARRDEHLEPLKRIVPNMVIVDDRMADYRYRSVITRAQYKRYLCSQVDDITYWSHFKEALRDAQPTHLAQPMYSAAMQIWGIMGKLTHSVWAPKKDDKKGKTPPLSAMQQYQANKGVKPFPSAATSAAAKNAFTPELPFTDELEAVWAAGGIPALSASPPKLDVGAVAVAIRDAGGSLVFTPDALAAMTDEAFELVIRLQEKYGTTTKVAQALVMEMSKEILTGGAV